MLNNPPKNNGGCCSLAWCMRPSAPGSTLPFRGLVLPAHSLTPPQPSDGHLPSAPPATPSRPLLPSHRPRLCACGFLLPAELPRPPPGKLLLSLQNSTHVSPPLRSCPPPTGGRACFPLFSPSIPRSCVSAYLLSPAAHLRLLPQVSALFISACLGWHSEILSLVVVVGAVG